MIGEAYVAIPIALFQFIRKRSDIPFNWMFALFGVFIVACGATHWIEVWTLWNPSYWLAGSVKAITAAASVPTAVLLFFLLPKALVLPSVAQLEAAKRDLEQEIERRKNDIGLPTTDGYEVARVVHRSSVGYRPLLVAVTGWGADEDKARARLAGFDRHLTKPIKLEDLAAVLAPR